MKRILFLIIAIVVSLNGYAQDEFSTKSKVFAPIIKSPKPKKAIPPDMKIPPITTPNVFKNPSLLDPKPTPGTISMTPKNNYINPGDAYRDKLNKKEENNEGIFYRKNQNLGNFKTSSLTANVKYRDAAYVDGDQIRVYLNDKVVQYQVDLDGSFKGFEIVLEKGFNKIDFEAINEGTSSPNTAEFQVFDDKGALISANQWNLGTGFKATIIITKE